MAALSDYLESQLLNHLFKSATLSKPTNISIALTTDVGRDNDTGATLPEVPSGYDNGGTFTTTGYARKSLGDPLTQGDTVWSNVGTDDTTAYIVDNGTEVGHSGYFYPLYLNQTTAQNADTGNPKTATSYTFSQFPGITFYGPTAVVTSGAADNTTSYPLYEGNGFIKNNSQIIFGTALSDWGWVSGIAIVDNASHGNGNVLMYSELSNPRYVYTGDNIKFDTKSLELSLD